ncbi:hypothetical protein ABT337_31905 [Saccharopolyspora hirsuta]|uniref:hypothetical protein n=1 Tax=Saccharopolyspora hirsuta TaxID=1837 RepID=UPI0024821684|nr:hypothetical protein [Saccharopolyspora hirsuta]
MQRAAPGIPQRMLTVTVRAGAGRPGQSPRARDRADAGGPRAHRDRPVAAGIGGRAGGSGRSRHRRRFDER